MNVPRPVLSLVEVARRLDGARMRWAVFAGAAAAVYGAARPTADLDILVPAADGKRLAALFPEFLPSRSPSGILWIELPGFDFLAGLEAMDLDEAMAARLQRHSIQGVAVPVIPPEDNILLKALWGRGAERGKHDWEDVRAMVAAQPALDWDYLRWRAGSLACAPQREGMLARLEALWQACGRPLPAPHGRQQEPSRSPG